jgi:hypothetical protein
MTETMQFLSLPDDMLHFVFKHLDALSLFRAASISCKRLHVLTFVERTKRIETLFGLTNARNETESTEIPRIRLRPSVLFYSTLTARLTYMSAWAYSVYYATHELFRLGDELILKSFKLNESADYLLNEWIRICKSSFQLVFSSKSSVRKSDSLWGGTADSAPPAPNHYSQKQMILLHRFWHYAINTYNWTLWICSGLQTRLLAADLNTLKSLLTEFYNILFSFFQVYYAHPDVGSISMSKYDYATTARVIERRDVGHSGLRDFPTSERALRMRPSRNRSEEFKTFESQPLFTRVQKSSPRRTRKTQSQNNSVSHCASAYRQKRQRIAAFDRQSLEDAPLLF